MSNFGIFREQNCNLHVLMSVLKFEQDWGHWCQAWVENDLGVT